MWEQLLQPKQFVTYFFRDKINMIFDIALKTKQFVNKQRNYNHRCLSEGILTIFFFFFFYIQNALTPNTPYGSKIICTGTAASLPPAFYITKPPWQYILEHLACFFFPAGVEKQLAEVPHISAMTGVKNHHTCDPTGFLKLIPHWTN